MAALRFNVGKYICKWLTRSWESQQSPPGIWAVALKRAIENTLRCSYQTQSKLARQRLLSSPARKTQTCVSKSKVWRIWVIPARNLFSCSFAQPTLTANQVSSPPSLRSPLPRHGPCTCVAFRGFKPRSWETSIALPEKTHLCSPLTSRYVPGWVAAPEVCKNDLQSEKIELPSFLMSSRQWRGFLWCYGVLLAAKCHCSFIALKIVYPPSWNIQSVKI